MKRLVLLFVLVLMNVGVSLGQGSCAEVLIPRTVPVRGVVSMDLLRAPFTPQSLDISYVVEMLTSQGQWETVVSGKKTGLLANKKIERVFSINFLNGVLSLKRGLYRVKIKNSIDSRKTFYDNCSFKEIPVFSIGGKANFLPWVGPAYPFVGRDGRLFFPAVFEYAPQAKATFIQFQEKGVAVYQSIIKLGQTKGQEYPRAQVVLPNTFREDIPVWIHVIQEGNHYSTYQKVWDPTIPGLNVWGGFGPGLFPE